MILLKIILIRIKIEIEEVVYKKEIINWFIEKGDDDSIIEG